MGDCTYRDDGGCGGFGGGGVGVGIAVAVGRGESCGRTLYLGGDGGVGY